MTLLFGKCGKGFVKLYTEEQLEAYK